MLHNLIQAKRVGARMPSGTTCYLTQRLQPGPESAGIYESGSLRCGTILLSHFRGRQNTLRIRISLGNATSRKRRIVTLTSGLVAYAPDGRRDGKNQWRPANRPLRMRSSLGRGIPYRSRQ